MNNWICKSRIRGHVVATDDGHSWYYEDNEELYDKNDRPCTACGIEVAHDQPDPCLGWLDGVDYACCGHGVPGDEYVLAKGIRYESVREWNESSN